MDYMRGRAGLRAVDLVVAPAFFCWRNLVLLMKIVTTSSSSSSSSSSTYAYTYTLYVYLCM